MDSLNAFVGGNQKIISANGNIFFVEINSLEDYRVDVSFLSKCNIPGSKKLFFISSFSGTVCVTDLGRAYWLPSDDLIDSKRKTGSNSKTDIVNLSPGENVTATFTVTKEMLENPDEKYIFLGTKEGTVKKIRLSKLSFKRRKSGFRIISLVTGDKVIGAVVTGGKSDIYMLSESGKVNRYYENEVRPMDPGARGVLGYPGHVKNFVSLNMQSPLIFVTSKGFFRSIKSEDYPKRGRGYSGVQAGFQDELTGEIVGMVAPDGVSALSIEFSNDGYMFLNLPHLNITGRTSKGKKAIVLDDGEKIKNISLLNNF